MEQLIPDNDGRRLERMDVLAALKDDADLSERDERRVVIHEALTDIVRDPRDETAKLVLRDLGWLGDAEEGVLGVLDRLSMAVPRKGTTVGAVSASERLVWARTVGGFPAAAIMAAWDKRDRAVDDPARRPVASELLMWLRDGRGPSNEPQRTNGHGTPPWDHPVAYRTILVDVESGVRHVCRAEEEKADHPCHAARLGRRHEVVLDTEWKDSAKPGRRPLAVVMTCPACGGVDLGQYESAQASHEGPVRA